MRILVRRERRVSPTPDTEHVRSVLDFEALDFSRTTDQRRRRYEIVVRRSRMAATVPVELENGATIVIEDVAPLPVGATTDETVHIEHFGFGDKVQKFDHVNEVIEGIANELKTTLDRVTPHSATVEFGLEITGEPGYLTAALVKGSGTAHLTITLEWERNGATPAQN
jgi:hypothetical protein